MLGGIGKTDRENRDAMRVLGGGGCDIHTDLTHKRRTTEGVKEI